MNHKKIVLGKHYRLKDSQSYGYVKALQILNIHEIDKTKNYLIVKCEHTVSKNDTVGFIRYFRPRDMIDESAPKKEGDT